MSRFKKVFIYYFVKNERVRAFYTLMGIAIGELILLVATLVAGNEDMIPIGTLCAAFACGMITVFNTMFCFAEDCAEMIRFGVTRKCAILAASVETLFLPMLYVLALALFEFIERTLFRLFFGLDGGGLIFVRFIPIALCICVAVWIMGLLTAWCIRRFGQNGMIALYCIYIVVFVCIPQISIALAERVPFISSIAAFIASNSVLMLVLAAFGALIGAVLLIRGLYRVSI